MRWASISYNSFHYHNCWITTSSLFEHGGRWNVMLLLLLADQRATFDLLLAHVDSLDAALVISRLVSSSLHNASEFRWAHMMSDDDDNVKSRQSYILHFNFISFKIVGIFHCLIGLGEIKESFQSLSGNERDFYDWSVSTQIILWDFSPLERSHA